MKRTALTMQAMDVSDILQTPTNGAQGKVCIAYTPNFKLGHEITFCISLFLFFLQVTLNLVMVLIQVNNRS